MTSKLRRKLQTTIRRITANPLKIFGRQEVCRPAVCLSAILLAGIAGAEDARFVRPADYQNNYSGTGNVPLVRIDSVSEESQQKISPVAYMAPVTNSGNSSAVKADAVRTSQRDSSTTLSGKPLKWVSVNSPEARQMEKGDSSDTSNAAVSSPSANRNVSAVRVRTIRSETAEKTPLVTPIPSVMPRYSHIRLTSGEDELLGLDLDNVEETPEAAGNGDALDSLGADLLGEGAGADAGAEAGLDGGLDAGEGAGMDAGMDAGAGEVNLDDGTLDVQNGNSNVETLNSLDEMDGNPVDVPGSGADSMLPSDGGMTGPLAIPAAEGPESEALTPETPALQTQNPGAIGNEKESIPVQGGLNDSMQMPAEPAQTRLPAAQPQTELPMNDDFTDSIMSRQVDEEDYDMPCESSQPMHRITEITNDIDLHDHKIIPKSCPLAPNGELFPPREFAGTNFTWTASNLCHNPLYFEQPALERYGHTIGPLQPVLSGAQFLATIPAMPMLMAIDPPNECQYALGYYRPGSCAPRKWSPLPYSTRGAIAEGGIATALIFLIP